jgi:hypothetical protein
MRVQGIWWLVYCGVSTQAFPSLMTATMKRASPRISNVLICGAEEGARTQPSGVWHACVLHGD